ncbi:GNAT family N-acetyltransferase [Paraburkholderia sp. EG287B]|uniref:GNAT family N-acetyltransferase n=1 Tax=unclassified Paraburkholderia TaxID=2615204 RepID=UPI0034D2F37F
MKESSVLAIVRREDPRSLDASLLLDEVSAMVALYSGDGAQTRFRVEEATSPRGAFVVARTAKGEAMGCGAVRRFSFEVAELKRIYRRPEWPGAGSAILHYLERIAVTLGFRCVVLQTRAANRRSIAFYGRHGYRSIEPYGEYVRMGDARCFSKALPLVTQTQSGT